MSFPDVDNVSEEDFLKIENLKTKYAPVLEDISFTVKKDEILGLKDRLRPGEPSRGPHGLRRRSTPILRDHVAALDQDDALAGEYEVVLFPCHVLDALPRPVERDLFPIISHTNQLRYTIGLCESFDWKFVSLHDRTVIVLMCATQLWRHCQFIVKIRQRTILIFRTSSLDRKSVV